MCVCKLFGISAKHLDLDALGWAAPWNSQNLPPQGPWGPIGPPWCPRGPQVLYTQLIFYIFKKSLKYKAFPLYFFEELNSKFRFRFRSAPVQSGSGSVRFRFVPVPVPVFFSKNRSSPQKIHFSIQETYF